jgi:hypothetical protein
MVLCGILVQTGAAEKAALPLSRTMHFLRLPPVGATAFLMSITSGYPTGARVVAQLFHNGAIDTINAQKLAILCSTTGPLFCLASVGVKMFGSVWIGVKIYGCHILSCLIIGLISARFYKGECHTTAPLPHKPQNILYDCFYSATVAVLVAGAFIAFFATAAQIISDFQLFYPLRQLLNPLIGKELSSAVCTGLVEMTSGCAVLGAVGGKLAIALAGFLITFGGLSVLMQQLSYLTTAGVRPFRFIVIKGLQATLCFLLLLLIA